MKLHLGFPSYFYPQWDLEPDEIISVDEVNPCGQHNIATKKKRCNNQWEQVDFQKNLMLIKLDMYEIGRRACKCQSFSRKKAKNLMYVEAIQHLLQKYYCSTAGLSFLHALAVS